MYIHEQYSGGFESTRTPHLRIPTSSSPTRLRETSPGLPAQIFNGSPCPEALAALGRGLQLVVKPLHSIEVSVAPRPGFRGTPAAAGPLAAWPCDYDGATGKMLRRKLTVLHPSQRRRQHRWRRCYPEMRARQAAESPKR